MRKQFASPLPALRAESASEGPARPPDAFRSPRQTRAEGLFGNRDWENLLSAAHPLLADGAVRVPGQMTKTAFLDALQQAVSATADEGLAAANRTSEGCPWISHWFEYYRDKSSQHLERAIHRFAPESAAARHAREYIPAVAARVRRGVDRWARTGDLADLPAGIPAPDPRSPESVRLQLGPGEPIQGATRARMESVLGARLDKVRLHTHSRAAELASGLRASAFTVGQHIAFAAGKYQPGTPRGDALLAHELAHVLQQEGPGGDSAPAALERDANRSAAAGLAGLWSRASQGLRNAAPRMRTGLSIQACSSDAFRTRPKSGNYVEFLSGHPLSRHSSDRRADPVWVPGATDHAAAYTKGASPRVAARTGVSGALAGPGASPVSVRVKENGAVRGTRAGLAPSAGSVELTDLTLTGLSGSDEVRAGDYTFLWEGSLDGANWTPLMTSGPHRIYWLFASPKVSPLTARAASKATQYAAGKTGAQDVAAAIRGGLRRIDNLAYNPSDPIDDDPLSIFTNGIGICTDYANILTLLALSVGLNANAVMFFGGFQSLGKSVWATLGASLLSLLNVRSPDPAFNPNPAGWAFTYHAISRIEGVLHDAALDRVGIDGQAVHQGKIIRLVELAPAPLPAAALGAAYASLVQRKDHLVEVSIRDYGPKITRSAFSDVYALHLPPAQPSPINMPVAWSLAGGALPPGLILNPASGLVSGTPSTAGSFSAQVKTAAPGLEHITPVAVTVNP